MRYNRVRSELFIASAALIMIATYVSGMLGNFISINSVLLLLMIYLPWIFCISAQFRDLYVPLARLFVRIMLVAAVVGLGQMAAQLSGAWVYKDYILSWVPENFLAQNYNTSYELAWNDPTTKANAFVFLEPSFLCQYLALAWCSR